MDVRSGPELHWVKNSSHVSIAPLTHVTINAVISLLLTKVAREEGEEANFGEKEALPENNTSL